MSVRDRLSSWISSMTITRGAIKRKREGSSLQISARQDKKRSNLHFAPERSINMAKECLSQLQSPLFQLPAEIRALIWQFALVRYVEESERWDARDPWYRPDYQGPKHLANSLLQSCHRIYREAHHLPLAQAEHTFWFDSGRAPWPMDHAYFGKFTPVQLANIERVQFYCQLYFVERGTLNFYFMRQEFRPKHLTLTIRHTDWWDWENDEPLGEHAPVEQNFRLPISIKTFVLRLETLARKKKQLDEYVVNAIKTKTFRTWDTTALVVDEKSTAWTWVGKYPKDSNPPVDEKAIRENQDAEYYVVDITFRAPSA